MTTYLIAKDDLGGIAAARSTKGRDYTHAVVCFEKGLKVRPFKGASFHSTYQLARRTMDDRISRGFNARTLKVEEVDAKAYRQAKAYLDGLWKD